MSQIHTLKTHDQFFDAVARGEKRFEVRKNDRKFQRGDTVILKRFDPVQNIQSGGELMFTVGWTLYGPAFGVEAGYCVFSLDAPAP